MKISPEDQDVLELLIGFAYLGRTWTESVNRRVGFDVSDNQSIALFSRLAIDGAVRPGEIMELTGLSSGGATKLVTRLEEQGLVSRSHGSIPDDRRAVLVSLTPRGEEVVAEFAGEFRRLMVALGPLLKDLSNLAGNV